MYAAGILPITWIHDEAYFLLGKDSRDGSWSDFAGRSESVDRDVAACAAREFWEETHGLVVGEAKVMRLRLNPATSIMVESKTQNGLPFYCYITEIPFLPHLRASFQKSVSFLKNRTKTYIEKTDVRWVSWSELIGGALPKRGVFKHTLEQHRGLLAYVVKKGPTGFKAACSAFGS